MASNPTRSRRGRILDALTVQLQTITVANGYASDVKQVTTNVKNWNDVADFNTPVLYIVDEKTKYNYHAGRLTERDWTVSIFGVLKNRSNPQDDMEELIADIEDCLTANMTLAGSDGIPLISHMRIMDIVTDRQLFAEIEGSALFKVVVVIKYTAQVDSIR